MYIIYLSIVYAYRYVWTKCMNLCEHTRTYLYKQNICTKHKCARLYRHIVHTVYLRFNLQKRTINQSEVIWCFSLQILDSIWVCCSMPKSTQKNSQIELDQPCQSVPQKLVARVTHGEGHACPSGMRTSTTGTFYGWCLWIRVSGFISQESKTLGFSPTQIFWHQELQVHVSLR